MQIFNSTSRGRRAQAEQQKIFERFYRVGDVQRQFRGMGTGLYISSEIIKNHDGTLWVETKPGKGSLFSFTLPLDRSKGKGLNK
ncbi:ATP-binding protein [Mucilaginibacter endophyticus]|uniref:sensor histidine kinase n=1 Tax=Mucilaginibacter endophyticus TaxID=2675003 RepID=UPI000E0DBD8E